MARYCCLRVFASFLHVVNALASGLFCFYALVGVLDDKECLPPLIDYFGDSIRFTTGLPTMCNTAHCLMAAICVLNMVMCLGVNCLLQNLCMMFTHLILAIAMCIFAVFGATVFSVHYMLWCDSLLQKGRFEHDKCKSAAKDFDNLHHTKNATWYYDRIELQQIGLWTISDLMILTIIVYLIVIKVVSGSTPSQEDTETPTGNYRYVVLSDESTPLVNPMSSLSTSSRNDFVRESYVHREPPPRYQAHEFPTERHDSPGLRSRGSSSVSGLNPFETDRRRAETIEETQGTDNPRYVSMQEESRPLLTSAAAGASAYPAGACSPGLLIDLQENMADAPPLSPEVEERPVVGASNNARSTSIGSESTNLLH